MTRKRNGLKFDKRRLLYLVNGQLSSVLGNMAKYANKNVKRKLSNKYLRKVTGTLWRNTGARQEDKSLVFFTTWYGVIWNEDKSIAYQKVGKRKQPESYLKIYNKRKAKVSKTVDQKWKGIKKRPFIRDAIKDTIKYGFNQFKRLKRGRI